MNHTDVLKLMSSFSLKEAASLIAGYNHLEVDRLNAEIRAVSGSFDDYSPELIKQYEEKFPKQDMLENLIVRAIEDKVLVPYRLVRLATPTYVLFSSEIEKWELNSEIDRNMSRVTFEGVRDWLETMGCTDGYFFSNTHKGIDRGNLDNQYKNRPDPMNRESKFFAPKLAAAIEAWETLQQDPKLQDANAVVKAATDWLTENAERLSILWTDPKTGKTAPPKSTTEAMAKIINWNDKGGVNKTP